MLALPWMRNHLGGHGQGRDEKPLPEPYARLALGLAAVFDEFIVGLAIERDSSLVRVTDQRAARTEEVPVDESDFVLFPAASGTTTYTVLASEGWPKYHRPRGVTRRFLADSTEAKWQIMADGSPEAARMWWSERPLYIESRSNGGDSAMGDPGFEPGTSSLSEKRSNRLS
jgi:hypothetical protein